MAIVWIGDFRCKSLQCVYEASNKTDADHFYIIDDLGGSDWTSSDAMYQLEKLCPVSSHIVIMTGLIDCVNSCIWKTVNIDKVAENYKTTIEKLKSIYNGHLFYFCSVPQVAGDYSSSFAPNGVITAKVLNEKIKKFNEKMKEICPATFIDCYDYISKTSLETRDGLRYTADTAKALQEFVSCQVNLYSITIGNTFMSKVRSTNADAPNPQDESYKYWTSEYNDCYIVNGNTVLPNCTGYAWGRFYEITGEKPTLSTSDAQAWYGNTSDGYDRGNTPLPGAVICWSGNDYGHVAIVEVVNSDGSIIISQSAFRADGITYDPTNTSHFWTETCTNSDGDWGWGSSGFTFQGFIYCPQTTPVTNNNNTTNADTDTISLYTTNSSTTANSTTTLPVYGSVYLNRTEMEPFAKYIWQYLGSLGWSVNAVAAVLGNMEQESNLNPHLWESQIDGSTIKSDDTQVLNYTEIEAYYDYKERYPGYGLVQWTPYYKYTDWCVSNKLNYWEIDSQLKRIKYESENELQWDDSFYDYEMTFKEFVTSTKSAYDLAYAFVCCYERPSSICNQIPSEVEATKTTRGNNANYWLSIISGLSPTLVGSTTTSTQLRLTAFKVDKKTSTQVKLSFVANNSTSCSYILKQGTRQIATKKANFTGGVKSFTLKNLIPNTKYTISLEVLGANSSKETKELSFTTLQSYPESIRDIFLDPNLTENYKDACNSFRLIVNQPGSLGYWKNNANGYELQLYVNSELIKKKTINKVKKLSMADFNIAKEFGYTCKTGDNIQIGVRTWVKTDTGTVLYDANTAKVSKPVCLLNKPVKSFLNLKKD